MLTLTTSVSLYGKFKISILYFVSAVTILVRQENTPMEVCCPATLANNRSKYNLPLIQVVQNVLLRWLGGELADRADTRSTNLAFKSAEKGRVCGSRGRNCEEGECRERRLHVCCMMFFSSAASIGKVSGMFFFLFSLE